MVVFKKGDFGFRDNTLIAIKGKIGKILNKYEFEVYFVEEKGIKYYSFFYQPTYSSFLINQTTKITEQEIINAFKEMLSILKNPVEKQKMIDVYVKIEQLTSEWDLKKVRQDIHNYEKQVEDFVLEVQGIKKRPDIKLRFKFLKKVNSILWEYKTDKYTFKLEKHKYEGVWDEYKLSCFENGKGKQREEDTLIDWYRNPTPKEIEDSIIRKLEEESIKEFIEKIEWSKVVKGISYKGISYELKLNNDGTISSDYIDKKVNLPLAFILGVMDIYDKDNNCLMTIEEYEKKEKQIIENGYKKYKKFK